MNSNFNPSQVLNSNLELNKMSVQAALSKFKDIPSDNSLKLVETDYLPCETTEIFKAYPDTPKEVIQYFRIKSVAAAVAGRPVGEYRKELSDQLAETGGNWLELFDPKWPGGEVENRHVRPVMWMALYHEYKKVTKEPVFAFRNVQQHAEEIEKFYANFCTEERNNQGFRMFITDREVMKIARELIEHGTCLGYVKFLRKRPTGITFS